MNEKVGGSLETSQAVRNFNKFIDDCEVVSLAATGVPFTWCNGHHDNTIIYEILDHALANPDWMRLLPHSELQNLPIVRSDHGPIFLKCNQISRRIPKILSLKPCGLPIRILTKLFHRFGIALTLEMLPSRSKLVEEVFYAQKARANWLELGDKNTKYFHTQALIRRKRNQILRVRDLNGLWVEGDILPEAFVQAFKLRLTAEQPPNHHLMMDFLRVIEPCVTSLDNENLLAPISDLELECALKSIGPLKSPGPDGLQAIFYQKCWDKTKHLIKCLVNDFLSTIFPFRTSTIPILPSFPKWALQSLLLEEFVKEIPYLLTFLFFAWNLL
ncbi:hypothetical protein L3X38_026890 [Prunus dulcis]|uniref:Uncharacterized protein n=1 Tax=Prunus dulcis TaxID=3755 RepID=A0AAD4VLW7_PRUDU|nr:hypothetical protein L3X38_026890 [Prunus dulcis]